MPWRTPPPAAAPAATSNKGLLYGLLPTWLSATTVRVANGTCRDSADAADMTLNNALGSEPVGDITATGALGIGSKGGVGTFSCLLGGTRFTNGSLGGPGIFDAYGLRAPTLTSFSSVGTALTGVGTRFLTEVGVGDLVGSIFVRGGGPDAGFSAVASIQDDTHLTLVAAFEGGDAAGGSVGLRVIENPTIQVGTDALNRLAVQTIAPNGFGGAVYGTFNSAQTAQNGTIGVRPTTSGVNRFYYLWLLSGGSGMTVVFSTQRTTPYAPTGYTTSARRIGTVDCDTSGNILKFYCSPVGGSRWFAYDDGGGSVTRVLSAGTATAWAKINAAPFVPPAGVAPWVYLIGTVVQGAAPNTSVRYRENASAGGSGFMYGLSETVNVSNVVYNWASNLGQGFEYQLDAAGSTTTAYCGVMAYVDALA